MGPVGLGEIVMIIPEGMTETEVMGVIEKVIDKMAPNYTFFGYDVDDIKQESFILCMDALERYDPDYPLENFLSKHLSFRLKTLMRTNRILDANYKTDTDSEKMKVLKPAQMDDNFSVASEEQMDYTNVDFADMVDIINSELPSAVRMDYLKMINNVYIPKPRREEITDMIKNILSEHGYYEKGQDL